jgi:mannosyltransferase OCH1-like enzyme
VCDTGSMVPIVVLVVLVGCLLMENGFVVGFAPTEGGGNIDLDRGYKLPVTPHGESDHYDPKAEIPKTIWMTTKFPSQAKRRMSRFFTSNKDCTIHILGDEDMDAFMNSKFANTSVLWAYSIINPKLMAAKADIWRIATLWMNGGMYIDADSYLPTPLASIVGGQDRFIFGAENNRYHDCYAPSYRLNRTDSSKFADGKIVVNWLMASAPKHPFLTQVLYDVVDTITKQYLNETYLYEMKRPQFFQIICSTGPGLLTAAMSEVISKNTAVPAVTASLQGHEPQYRFVGVDWKQYGASWKTPREAGGVEKYSQEPHYDEVMGKGGNLLRRYQYKNQ